MARGVRSRSFRSNIRSSARIRCETALCVTRLRRAASENERVSTTSQKTLSVSICKLSLRRFGQDQFGHHPSQHTKQPFSLLRGGGGGISEVGAVGSELAEGTRALPDLPPQIDVQHGQISPRLEDSAGVGGQDQRGLVLTGVRPAPAEFLAQLERPGLAAVVGNEH